jgi:GTPase Era involved in 16S rRNA processing
VTQRFFKLLCFCFSFSFFVFPKQEIPYLVRQRCVGWLETAEYLHVQQELLVPKLSQARMVIGRGGQVARDIAEQAASRLTVSLGKPVKIEIHAKHCLNMPDTEFD